MAKITTTLTDDNIRDAVADWVQKTFNTEIARSIVAVGVVSESVGYGMQEREQQRVNITYTTTT